MDKSNGILQELGIEGNFEETLDILVWISRRQFELSLFQRLQKSANQVFSLSERDLFNTANLLLQVLTFGLADGLGTSNIRLVTWSTSFMSRMMLTIMKGPQNDSNPLRLIDYLEQKGRIRSALFCYLQITISQLGSWNYFFDRIGSGRRFFLQKVLKGELNLNTFDENTKDQLQDSLDSFDRCEKWRETFHLPRGVTQSGLHEDDLKRVREEFDLAAMIEVMRSILREPPYRRDVEAIVHALTEFYRPCFDGIMNVYEKAFENEDGPDILTLTRAEIETLENFQKCLPQAMKDFEDFPNNEGKDEVYRGFMSMVAEALNRMLRWNEVLKIFFDAGILSRDEKANLFCN